MGVKQWIFQRISNVLIIVFGLWLLATVITHGGISYEMVASLLQQGWVRTCLLITLLFACVNSVLAGWQIVGDYAHKFGLNANLLMGIVVAVSAGYLFAGIGLLN